MLSRAKGGSFMPEGTCIAARNLLTSVYAMRTNLITRCWLRKGQKLVDSCHTRHHARWDHKQLLSVFSAGALSVLPPRRDLCVMFSYRQAPNYLDTGNNKGAFLKLSKCIWQSLWRAPGFRLQWRSFLRPLCCKNRVACAGSCPCCCCSSGAGSTKQSVTVL